MPSSSTQTDISELSAASKIGSAAGALTKTSGLSTAAADVGNVAGIYTGLEQGGFLGDTSAAINAAALAGRSGVLGGASSTVTEVAGAAGAALSIYEFAKNWQSGATGADTLSGAETGASVGTAIEPGIGTVVGAAVGAIAGAISSAFGPGERDPEQNIFATYQGLYNQYGAQMNAQNVPPSAAYQSLAGMFDARESYGNPLYNQFGRMGETSMLQGMTDQINSAINAGKIAPNATPAQIYSSVVAPWIAKMPGGAAWNSSGNNSSEGGNGVVQNLMTTLIGQYQAGQASQWNGVDNGPAPTLAPYGSTMSNAKFVQTLGADTYTASMLAGGAKGAQNAALSKITGKQAGAPTAMQTADAAALKGSKLTAAKVTDAVTQQITPALTSMPGQPTAASSPSATLPTALAIPAAAALGSAATAPAAGAPTVPNPISGASNTASTDQINPTAGAGAATAGGDSSSLLGTINSDISSFLSSPLGSLTEFGTLAGVGLSEANAQKNENDALAGSLSATTAPYTKAGQAELSQLTGGPAVGGPLGASITQQTTAASELGQTAEQYGTGNLTSAQQTQVQQQVAAQTAAAKAELAAAGITDPNSSQWQTRMQQIQDNAAVLTNQLVQQNTTIATGALTAVQNTYNNLLNNSLSSAEFGFSGQEAAVQTQIQSDTALAGQLQQLFGAIAEGFGTAMRGPSGGTTQTPAQAVANTAGQVASGVAKGASGVASTPSGGALPGASDAEVQQQMNTESGTIADSYTSGTSDSMLQQEQQINEDFGNISDEPDLAANFSPFDESDTSTDLSDFAGDWG